MGWDGKKDRSRSSRQNGDDVLFASRIFLFPLLFLFFFLFLFGLAAANYLLMQV